MSFDAESSKSIKAPKSKPGAQREIVISDTKHVGHQKFADREEWWTASCRACVKADRERQPVPDAELPNTIFVYPRIGRLESLAQAFLAKMYPNRDVMSGSSFPVWQIVSNPDIQIVCVRPVADVGGRLESGEVQTKDAFGKLVAVGNDFDKQLAQVCASEPLKVGELCELQPGSAGRIAISGRYSAGELLNRLSEAFAHCGCRVQVPAQDKPNEDLVVGL